MTPIAAPIIALTLAWDAKLPQATQFLMSELPKYQATFDTHEPLCKSKQDKNFWPRLMVEIARYESSFKPESEYYECSTKSCRYKSGCFYDKTRGYCMKGGVDGGFTVSRGLYQISFGSVDNYKCDLVKSPKDLHLVNANIDCALKIMEKQIKKNNKTLSNGTSYWAVMRPSNEKRKKILSAACK